MGLLVDVEEFVGVEQAAGEFGGGFVDAAEQLGLFGQELAGEVEFVRIRAAGEGGAEDGFGDGRFVAAQGGGGEGEGLLAGEVAVEQGEGLGGRGGRSD
jgi:hypothetical protein